MITANIKKVVTDAIKADTSAARKWLTVGESVRAEYTTREALEAVRAEFLTEVIYPAMGDDAVKVINADIPAKNHKDYVGASTELRAQWDAMKDMKATVRGKGSVFFGRVLKYAYPKDEGKGEGKGEGESSEATATKSPRSRIAARLGEAQTMIQKQEALTEHDKALLVAIAAWQTREAATK